VDSLPLQLVPRYVFIEGHGLKKCRLQLTNVCTCERGQLGVNALQNAMYSAHLRSAQSVHTESLHALQHSLCQAGRAPIAQSLPPHKACNVHVPACGEEVVEDPTIQVWLNV